MTRSIHRDKIPPRDDRDWVTSGELVNEAGITWRQADYWCRTGLLEAITPRTTDERYGDLPVSPETPGSGFPRRFHEDQVIKAYVLRNLVDVGLSLQICRHIIDDFLAHGSIDLGPFTLTTHPTTKETA